MIHLKIEETDGRTAVFLDDAVLATLRAQLGDTLSFDESAVEVTNNPDEIERQIALARQVMIDYRETLDALAPRRCYEVARGSGRADRRGYRRP